MWSYYRSIRGQYISLLINERPVDHVIITDRSMRGQYISLLFNQRPVSYLGPGIGARAYFDHDSAATGGVAGGVDSGPGAAMRAWMLNCRGLRRVCSPPASINVDDDLLSGHQVSTQGQDDHCKEKYHSYRSSRSYKSPNTRKPWGLHPPTLLVPDLTHHWFWVKKRL